MRVQDFDMNFEVSEGILPTDTLFIHGNLAANVWWEPAASIWKSRSAVKPCPGRMLMGEWRGCGKTSAPAQLDDLRPEKLARDYIAALRALHAKCVNIVAHSTGGLIALFALKEAPELFNRVVLLDPVGASGVQFPPAAREAFQRMSRDREFCALVMAGTIHEPVGGALGELFERIVDAAYGVAPANWLGIPDVLGKVEFGESLKHIRHPVLVLHGEFDPILPVADSRSLAEHLPAGTFKLLQGRGHSANVEDPAAFVKLVDDFLFNSSTEVHL